MLRILNIFPRTATPPQRGQAVRSYHLLRYLSEHHEVRQFDLPGWRGWRTGRSLEVRQHTPHYLEYQCYHPATALISEFTERSWARTPLTSGLGLAATRPALLAELGAWADVVMVDFPWQFEHCRKRLPKRPLVYASHNVEAEKYRAWAESAGVKPERTFWLPWVERRERAAMARADLVIAVSETDRDTFVERYRAAPEKIVVIPNGADTEAHRPVTEAERQRARARLTLGDRPAVMFIGSPAPPNQAAVEWIRRLARHLPEHSFLVVGRVFPQPWREGNLIATGPVEDPTEYEQASDLAVAPIETLGGTKLKVMEALAAGLPCVGFAEAARGTMLRHEEHLLVVAKSDQALAAGVRRVMGDEALRRRLGEGGRRAVVAHYDWRKLAVSLAQALAELHQRKASAHKG